MIENKIIGIMGEYPPFYSGGVAVHVKEIVKLLSKKNKIIVITSSPKTSKEFFGNVEIHRVKVIRKKHLTTLTSIFSSTMKALRLKNKIDLLHCHSLLVPLVGYIAKKLPMVITVHGYPSLETAITGRIKQNSIQFKLLRKIEKITARRADALIAVDLNIKNWLEEELKVDGNKVFLIPNGVDVENFNPLISGKGIRKKYRIKDDEKLIVIVRKFTPKNGVEIALHAFNLLIKKHNFINVRLLLAGGGELKERFVRIIKNYRLENNVILEDAIPHHQVPEYFASADIIINTFTHIPGVKEFPASSLYEALEKVTTIGTTLTTNEALASGKPLIVTAPLGKFEGISINDIGVLTPDNNPEILAEALSQLLRDEKLAEQIGKNGRKYIERNRTWNVNVEKLSHVYNFAISGRQ
jgi:glycosyltransferase involved in cell wall biosynthesis